MVWAQAVALATVDPERDSLGEVGQVVGTQVGPNGGKTLSDTTFVQR